MKKRLLSCILLTTVMLCSCETEIDHSASSFYSKNSSLSQNDDTSSVVSEGKKTLLAENLTLLPLISEDDLSFDAGILTMYDGTVLVYDTSEKALFQYLPEQAVFGKVATFEKGVSTITQHSEDSVCVCFTKDPADSLVLNVTNGQTVSQNEAMEKFPFEEDPNVQYCGASDYIVYGEDFSVEKQDETRRITIPEYWEETWAIDSDYRCSKNIVAAVYSAKYTEVDGAVYKEFCFVAFDCATGERSVPVKMLYQSEFMESFLIVGETVLIGNDRMFCTDKLFENGYEGESLNWVCAREGDDGTLYYSDGEKVFYRDLKAGTDTVMCEETNGEIIDFVIVETSEVVLLVRNKETGERDLRHGEKTLCEEAVTILSAEGDDFLVRTETGLRRISVEELS